MKFINFFLLCRKGHASLYGELNQTELILLGHGQLVNHLVRTIKFSLQLLVAVYCLKCQTKTVLPAAQYFKFVVFLSAATLFTYNMS